jgi:hypothetical protein
MIDYQEGPCVSDENNRNDQEDRSDEKAPEHDRIDFI